MGRKELLAAAIVVLSSSTKRKRSCWTREWVLRRHELGVNSRLLTELRVEDPSQYQNFLRMTAINIEDLIQKICPLIGKKDTKLRPAITVQERLFVTLRYLATGEYGYFHFISICLGCVRERNETKQNAIELFRR
jgi:hypothetical protein